MSASNDLLSRAYSHRATSILRMPRKIVLAGALAGELLSNGCMMAGMGSGMMGGMDSSRPGTSKAVLAEAQASGVHVILEFPPVMAGDEGTFTVDVRDTSGQPISAARVTLRLRRVGEDAGITLQAAQSSTGAAVYQATHRFTAAGSYAATAEVLIDARDPGSAVSVTAQQDVTPASHTSGRSGAVPVAILSGAVMAGMVLWMLVARRPF